MYCLLTAMLFATVGSLKVSRTPRSASGLPLASKRGIE